jgi:hypothetical protein
LTLERELPAGLVTRLSYAGSKGTRLAAPRELNPAVYAPGVTTATTNQRRPYQPALGSTPIVESVGISTYHALQWTIERRFQKGLTILGNYQFAKAIDDTSQNKQNGNARTNPANQRFDKGLAEFHRAHVFNFSGLYELPIRPSNPLMRTLVGGWNLNGIISLNSGQPLTPSPVAWITRARARAISAPTWWAIRTSRAAAAIRISTRNGCGERPSRPTLWELMASSAAARTLDRAWPRSISG